MVDGLPRDVEAEADVMGCLGPGGVGGVLIARILVINRSSGASAARISQRGIVVHAELRPAAIRARRTIGSGEVEKGQPQILIDAWRLLVGVHQRNAEITVHDEIRTGGVGSAVGGAVDVAESVADLSSRGADWRAAAITEGGWVDEVVIQPAQPRRECQLVAGVPVALGVQLVARNVVAPGGVVIVGRACEVGKRRDAGKLL